MTESDPAHLPKVAVPAGRRIQLAIKNWLPIVFFGLSCLACLLLWQFQQRSITLLGEVEVLDVTIRSAENGVVSAIVPGQPTSDLTYANIDKDQLVAVLDDRFLKERLVEAASQLDALATNSKAVAELKPIEPAVNRLRNEVSLVLATMQLRQLDATETERRQELSFEIEKIRADIGYDSASQITQDIAVESAQMQLANQQIRSLRSELAAISAGVGRLDSKSPIGGRVTKIHVSPGDTVIVGQPLLTLVPTQGRHVVAYSREIADKAPHVGMPVTIRTRTIPVQEIETSVDSVGPAIESIPSRQRALAQIEEWGRPIRVRIPSSIELTPGSLVEILFDHSASSR